MITIEITGHLSYFANDKIGIIYSDSSRNELPKYIKKDDIAGTKCPYDNKYITVSYNSGLWQDDIDRLVGKSIRARIIIKKYSFMSKAGKNAGQFISGYKIELADLSAE